MKHRAPREIEVSVESLDMDGHGLGQLDTRSVKAKNALPGETVLMKVLKRRSGTWYGEASTPQQERSPQRVEPACAYFPRCGGCAMQHLRYDAQLQLKNQHLLDALRSHGVDPGQILPPAHGPRLGYRTKARLGVRVVGGALLAGFRETYSNRVARMDSCETLIPDFSSLLQPLKRLISRFEAPARIPQIELAAGDADRAMIIRHLDPLSAADLDELRAFACAHDVMLYLQSAGYDSVVPLDPKQPAYLSYSNSDFGLSFQFAPWDFTQVNLAMNRRLVRTALSLLPEKPSARLLDLFCGIGNFSLAAAMLGFQVLGLEAATESVSRARMNALRNGLGARCEFQVADLYDPTFVLSAEADFLLLDPPRSGAGPNLEQWVESIAPEQIVYVSCQPESFARDACRLLNRGYQLDQVGIFDMFPNTAHVETLGSFTRKW